MKEEEKERKKTRKKEEKWRQRGIKGGRTI